MCCLAVAARLCCVRAVTVLCPCCDLCCGTLTLEVRVDDFEVGEKVALDIEPAEVLKDGCGAVLAPKDLEMKSGKLDPLVAVERRRDHLARAPIAEHGMRAYVSWLIWRNNERRKVEEGETKEEGGGGGGEEEC